MKNLLFYTLSFLVFFYSAKGTEIKYPIGELSKEITANAKAIIRDYETIFTVQSIGDGKMEVLLAITIMNKSGLEYSVFSHMYNKFFKIRNVNGKFYDKNGNLIKKMKRDELYDVPAISGYSLYEDSRALVYNPKINDFPFTAEYSFSIDFDGFIEYPDWNLYNDYNVSVQKRKLVLKVPNNMKLRSYYQNLEIEPQIIEDKGHLNYTWEVNELPALQEESFSPPLLDFSKSLFLAPKNFKIGGTEGNMDTWALFGYWISELNKERSSLSEETQNVVLDLMKDTLADTDKINVLYKFMQNRTRYVNVSVGMGGWQTEKAEDVDRLAYGDCKALSNYMYSLLNVVGIKSYYTLVRAGNNTSHILHDFPTNQFNHVILCVPQESDTVWLECTNSQIPAGYIGKFTDDREALLINGNNSKLVRTRAYSAKENMRKREAVVELNNEGGGRAHIKTDYIGLSTDEVYPFINSTDMDKKNHLYEIIKIPDFTLEDFKYNAIESEIPTINEDINLKLNNYGSIMEDRLIIPINLMNKLDNVPEKSKDRKNIVQIDRSSIEIDSVTYKIPDGYLIESAPEAITLNSMFGTYQTEIILNENMIHYKRTFFLNKGRYPKETYNDLRDFLISISKADFNKFVLVKSGKSI